MVYEYDYECDREKLGYIYNDEVVDYSDPDPEDIDLEELDEISRICKEEGF